MRSNELRYKILALIIIMVLLSACGPQPITPQVTTSAQPELAPGILEGADEIPTRTPLRRLVRRTPTDFDDELFASVQTQLKILVAIFGLDLALQRLGFLGEGNRQFLGDVFFILYLLMGLYLSWQLVLFTSEWYRDQLAERIGEERYDTVVPLIRRMIFVVLLILAFTILLDHFGFDISAITLIAVLIFLIYIAARDVLSDAINGFIILFDQPFRVGDRIKTLRMDTWGNMFDIGTRTTRIQTLDNRLVVIPNSDIANQQLDTYPDPTYRMQLDIGIQYNTDIHQLQAVITKAFASVEGVLADLFSKPVLAGFIVGVAITIVVGQLDKLLGYEAEAERDTLWVSLVEACNLYHGIVSPWDHPYGLNMDQVKGMVLNSWFDGEIADGIHISNGTLATRQAVVYGCGFFPLLEPVEIKKGDAIRLDIRANLRSESYVWRWHTRIFSGDDSHRMMANFQQATN